MTRAAWIVFVKELRDAMRDRRTLFVVFLSSVLLGPLVLIAVSAFVGALESRAQRREVWVDHLDRAPTLVNFLERQTFNVRTAPLDYERRLRALELGDPVIVVPADFESRLERGESPTVRVVSDSANRQAEAGSARVQRLLAAFARERATLALAWRGVAPSAMEPVRVQEEDLGTSQSRAAQVTGMLPFFVLLAVVYGALNVALDTTAGERERGSLEPLLVNPIPRMALVLGKWGAVSTLGMLIAALGSLSFLPAQALLQSEALAALFRYGLREALLFLVALLPFAGAISAMLMAIAIRSRTYREAQASTAVIVLAVSLLPLVSTLSLSGESVWQLAVPALGQHVVMSRVLRGDAIALVHIALPLLTSVVCTALSLLFVSRSLTRTAGAA